MSCDNANALTMFCMSQTPFRDDFSVDEAALRAHLRRLIAARNGIYMGSGGAGEGHVLYTSQPNVVQELTLGGAGSMGQENNAVPRICQSIADGYLASDMHRVGQATRALQRLNSTVQQFSEAPGSARGVKMTLKVLGLGNGIMRRPYVLPADDRLRAFKAALGATGVWELEQSLERQPVAAG
jgi:dihydrodipicolinate synthase/N-acetylneuraminate lyase